MMKVLGISGSPRTGGNTDILVKLALDVLAEQGIQTDFLISEMIVPGSTYWNVAFGREKGEVENDQEGLDTVRRLAENMVWLMKKLAD